MTIVETTKEKLSEAEIHRTAGEITLLSPEHDAAKAEAHFERALNVAREQKAKSWELRAAMSMAPTLARSGQTTGGSRSFRAGLWLVHRGFRHA